MVKTEDVVLVGLDLSLNAPGFLALNTDGHVVSLGYVTQKAKKFGSVECANALKAVSMHGKFQQSVMKPRKTQTKDREKEPADIFTARRREFTFYTIVEFIKSHTPPKSVENNFSVESTIVVMEDYAYSTQSTGQMELAEISGLIKNYLWLNEIPLRLLDPLSVKMFATGHGTSKKIHMRDAAADFTFKLPDFFFGEVKAKHPFEYDGSYRTHDLNGPGTDLVDAFYLAMFGLYELQLRRGGFTLDEIRAHERREFIKTTKTKPTNVLSRPYIAKEGKANWVDGE